MPPIVFDRWRAPAVLVALALVLGACGRADQAAQQPSAAPLAPLPATPETVSATPGTRPTPFIFRPTPDNAQRAGTAIAETIDAEGEYFNQTADAVETATAAWAQTPEPTIVPPADGTRLRDLWPASQQQAAAPTRLYLRSWDGRLNADIFWEVRLPDIQFRRLPAVELESVDNAAQVSPDGRFLAYVTGTPRRDLRLLDLATDADVGIDVPVMSGLSRCRRQIAWSPDGRTLAVRAIVIKGAESIEQLRLYQPHIGPTPQPLLEPLPGAFELLGWLDDQRLLIVHWSRKDAEPVRLLVVDRQGNQTPIGELKSGFPRCSSLSPNGRDLIYKHDTAARHLQLDTGQEQRFSNHPEELFWLGDGRTLLVSPFDNKRTVWLRTLDQPEQQRLFLSPPYQSDYRFRITGVSPDGSLLVACEQRSSDNPRIRSTTARNWLYDIAQDRWTYIRDSTTGSCDLVLGWSTPEGGP